MRQILDYDPLTGAAVYMEVKDDKMIVTHAAGNLTPFLDMNAAMRSDTDRSKKGIKNDWWHYARIREDLVPIIEQKHGVKFSDKNDLPKILALINSEYAHLKVTDLQHNLKHA